MKNKQKKERSIDLKIIFGIIGVIVILCLIIITIFLVNRKGTNNYIIHYSTDYYTYDIKVKNNNLYIEKSEKVQCIKEPCNPANVDSYKIKYQKEYQELIAKLFKNKKGKEITVTSGDLDSEDIKMMSSIVGNEMSYNIIDSSKENTHYSKRGYYVENDNGKMRITIAMGERETDGYSISVAKIIAIEDEIQIYVKETSPSEDDNVIDAFTYPIVQMNINKIPSNIIVQNLDNNEKFEKIDLN